MTTSSLPNRQSTASSPPTSFDLEAFACQWELDLRSAGAERERPFMLRIGLPALALIVLGVAVLVAFLDRGDGPGVAPLSVALVLIAALPWASWLIRGDDGPTWWFAAIALSPIAVLGIGQWFVDALSLGSGLAYPLLAFQSLLLVILGVAYAGDRMAIGYAIATYAAFGGPLLAAWLSAKAVDGAGMMTWNVVFAISAVAAYVVRLSYHANLDVTAAREALAWQAVAEERRRVARDVHDVVAHTLAVTMLHMTAARMAVQRGDAGEAEAALEEAERHGRASLADIRRVVRLLRENDSSALDAAQPGLGDIEALVDGYRAAGLPVELSLGIDERDLSPAAGTAVYRVLQEALANAARHGSGAATVQLRESDGKLVLNVGNPVRQAPSHRSQGSGLLGMRERIAAAGGTIDAGVQQGRWVVRAVLPGGASA